jgi:hypothetical protein
MASRPSFEFKTESQAEGEALKLLLDVHIKKAAVAALTRAVSAVDVAHIADWKAGALRTAEDREILSACAEDNRVFVTYDQRTIPGLLRTWAAEERSHAGVILGDDDSVPSNDPGAVAKALKALLAELSDTNMTNVVRHLRRPGS